MTDVIDQQILRTTRRQYGLITMAQARAAGLSPQQVQRASCGPWKRVHRGVYAVAGAPATPERALLAACLATRGRASHESAAWLWALVARSPRRPTVTVARDRSRPQQGMVIHRARDLPRGPAPLVRGIPCTDVVRTLVDLATEVPGAQLDDAVDRALARRLVTIPQLMAVAGRRAAAMRRALVRRGHIGAPSPSVLESRTLRLLHRGGIVPRHVELTVDASSGRYRLDVVLAGLLAMEVDGYAYHASPESMARDHRRRNELLTAGWTILVFTWTDISNDGDRVLRSVGDALRRAG